jgi:hypothetical protein
MLTWQGTLGPCASTLRKRLALTLNFFIGCIDRIVSSRTRAFAAGLLRTLNLHIVVFTVIVNMAIATKRPIAQTILLSTDLPSGADCTNLLTGFLIKRTLSRIKQKYMSNHVKQFPTARRLSRRNRAQTFGNVLMFSKCMHYCKDVLRNVGHH